MNPLSIEEQIEFTNAAPEDKEWSAHIRLLNDWQNPERLLRDIVQYARSGPFYPADMHVQLIEQVFAHQCTLLLEELLGGLPEKERPTKYQAKRRVDE